MLAGHDTTASSLANWLWELAKHPEWQTRVRAEVRAARRRVVERGDSAFTIADLDGMAVLQLTLKEALVWFGPLYSMPRELLSRQTMGPGLQGTS